MDLCFFWGGCHSCSGGWIRVHDVRVSNNQQNIKHLKVNSGAFYYVLVMYTCLLYVHICVCTRAMVCMWESEDNCWESVASFHPTSFKY